MNKKSNAAAVVSYLTWVGWVIALVIRDPQDRFTSHHMNQSLIINILEMIGGLLAVFPLIGGLASKLIGVIVFVFWLIGIYRAATWSTQPLPFIGDIHIID